MYLAFIDLHLAWRLHLTNIGRKPQLGFYPFYQNFITKNFNWGKAPNPIMFWITQSVEVVSKSQITSKDKARVDEKAQHTR